MTEATVTKKNKSTKAPKLFSDELIDQLLAQVQGKDAESVLGESGLAGQLKKRLAERMLAAELSHHLEAETEQGKAGNHRNGTSSKTVLTPNGELKLDIILELFPRTPVDEFLDLQRRVDHVNQPDTIVRQHIADPQSR